jgi:hypothetical protein
MVLGGATNVIVVPERVCIGTGEYRLPMWGLPGFTPRPAHPAPVGGRHTLTIPS